jgi:hypothetical protein
LTLKCGSSHQWRIQPTSSIKIDYLTRLRKLIEPIGDRSVGLLNSRLLIVGGVISVIAYLAIGFIKRLNYCWLTYR